MVTVQENSDLKSAGANNLDVSSNSKSKVLQRRKGSKFRLYKGLKAFSKKPPQLHISDSLLNHLFFVKLDDAGEALLGVVKFHEAVTLVRIDMVLHRNALGLHAVHKLI